MAIKERHTSGHFPLYIGIVEKQRDSDCGYSTTLKGAF